MGLWTVLPYFRHIKSNISMLNLHLYVFKYNDKMFLFLYFVIIANLVTKNNLSGGILQSLRGYFFENRHFSQLAVCLNEVLMPFGTLNGCPQTA